MRDYLQYALWTDLRRRSTWALVLSMIIMMVSIALCAILFASARAIEDAVEAEMIRSGASNSMDVAARTDRDYQKPWAVAPISSEDPSEALARLKTLMESELGDDVMTHWQPAWLSPGWVYLFLTPPEQGGTPAAVGVSLTSATDPEKERIFSGQLAGGWVDDVEVPQIILPKKVADRLWPDVMFVGETAFVGIAETSTCAEVKVVGIYEQTQRNYCYANEAVAVSIQNALEAAREEPVVLAGGTLAHDRVRIYFKNRRDLARARILVEERYRFWASTPYDKFESKLNLVTAVRRSAWVVFAITLGAACGSVFCTFLAWVSRRRYEIALMKAQGSGNAWVAGLYMLQGGAAGLVAGSLGVWVGAMACPAIARVVSERLELAEPVALALPGSIGCALVAAAVGVSVLAAMLPARVAARQDPWSILRETI